MKRVTGNIGFIKSNDMEDEKEVMSLESNHLESDFYKALFLYDAEPVVICSSQGKIKEVNQLFEKTFNKLNDEVKNLSFEQVFPPSIKEALLLNFNLCLKGEAMESRQLWLQGKVPVYYNFRFMPIKTGQSIDNVIIKMSHRSRQLEINQRIKENEERLEHISRASNNIFWDLNIVTGEIWWNKQAKNFFGYDNSLMGSFDWWGSMIHPEDRERVIETFNHAVVTKKEFWQEKYRFRNANNDWNYVLDRGTILYDNNNNAYRSIGAIIDLSPIHEYQKSLNISEANFSALIQNSKELIFSIDTEGKIITFNKAFETHFSKSINKSFNKGDNYFELLPSIHREMVTEHFEKALLGEYQEVEVEHNEDRETHYLRVFINPLFGNEGNVTGVCYFIRDVTERKQTEIKIKESEERFRTLVETTYEGLVQTDNSNNILFANKRFADMVGCTIDEILAAPQFRNYMIEEDFKLLDEMNIERLKGISGQYEFRLKKKNGDIIWVLVSGSPIIDHISNKVIGTLGAFTDISERIKTEEKLIKINRELDQFAYIVSHDLKAPLRGINYLANWIAEDLSDNLTPELEKIIILLKQRIGRMENMINGILEYSRVGKTKTPAEFFDLNILVKEEMEVLDSNNSCVLEINTNLPSFTTYKIALQQVFSNLISNAIKYNDKDKCRVVISHSEDENYYWFSVEDDGPGIDPDYHSKIFEVFQTLQSRDEIESTGIGLSIVLKIIEDMNGKVYVESEAGKGAKFTFSWPKKTL